MRIGLITPGFSANQADWCIPALRHLARQLALTDAVRVVAIRYPYARGRYAVDGAEVIALGGATRRGAATLQHWRQTLDCLRAEHRRQPFDVLHAFWATESGLLAALAGQVLRVPTLISVAGGELVALPDIGYGDQRLAWERFKIRASLRLASATSAGSCQLLDLLQRYAPTQPRRYLPLGVDLDLFQPQPPSARPKLVHVGALVPVKDQHLLLHAFARLRRSRPDALLEIVGEGALGPRLQHLARALAIQDAVCFTGAVDHAALTAVYANAAAFVLSSRHEAQGMVALEAAASGRGVVGTRVGVVPQLEAAGAGSSTPIGDVERLADALDASHGDAEATRQGGEAARALIEREFSLQRCTDRFRAVYSSLPA